VSSAKSLASGLPFALICATEANPARAPGHQA